MTILKSPPHRVEAFYASARKNSAVKINVVLVIYMLLSNMRRWKITDDSNLNTLNRLKCYRQVICYLMFVHTAIALAIVIGRKLIRPRAGKI